MRSMLKSWRWLLAMTFLAVAQPSFATEAITFDSCTDVAGHTVAAEADYALPTLVQTSDNTGRPSLRYNPSLLPELSASVRQFFYAHECARHALGLAGKAELSYTQVQRADCVAAATLLASGLLQRENLQTLQRELNFDKQAWQLLPGPPRAFDLTSCRSGGVLKMPAPTMPTVQQSQWNACVRGCADRLWTCQKGCRGEACQGACTDSHAQCETTCGPAASRAP